MSTHSIAVVIPSYKVKSHILSVIKNIGPEVDKIYVIDDCCPENSGAHVAAHNTDERVIVLKNEQNLGVGGAVVRGYLEAANDGMTIVVKVDGDGQMDPLLIPDFIAPIIRGEADYTKGNRFYDLKHIHKMPTIRIAGNAILSFMGKISTGYWDIFDPTNGFTAIHIDAVKRVSLEKVSRRFFFETDLLFRLYLTRAVVLDIPMNAVYGDEKSNLKISKVIIEFLFKHIRNFLKRVGYSYYLRGMSLASLELPIGLSLLLFGLFFGANHWVLSYKTGALSSAGTVMLSAMPIISGLQFILAFFAADMSSIPKRPIQGRYSVQPKFNSQKV